MSVARRATAAAGQLSLELTSHLPALAIEPDWKVQQRLWGHSFHPMCSYLASFPAAVAHAFVDRYTRPGDVVVDPFSGRGTTPLQAVAEGRIGVGNDLNPFAHLLTAAKVEPAARAESATRLTALQLGWRASAPAWFEIASAVVAETGRHGSSGVLVPGAGSRQLPGRDGEPVPPEVVVAFHPATLAQVLYVRSELRLDERTDRFLAASLAGALHGKTPSYLSTVMPNTFSMAPRYVRDFVRRSDFAAPRRDLFALLDAKLRRLYRDPVPSAPGIALLGDARDSSGPVRRALRARGLPERARLVVTSPPYLRVVKYGYYNWLRTWLLGFDSAAIDASLDDAHHREPYLQFLREVLADLRGILADDAVVVLVIGDVETDRGRRISHGVGLAEAAWEEAAAPEGYRLAGLTLDEVSAARKMTRLWGTEAGRATKVDRILVMGATDQGRRRALSAASMPVDWSWPPRRLRVL